MTIRIVGPHGDEISSLEEWAKLHKVIHWKEGSSAHCVAEFMLNRGGAAHLESRLSEVLRREVSICLITPEKEIRFDKYGRGRFHDLAIQGFVGSNEPLFVGLEAKVNEKFGPTMDERYEDAVNKLEENPRSRAVERIKALPARFAPILNLDSMLDIRYQLVHGTAGTVAAQQENKEPFDVYVFYTLVFKTSLYDERVGEENHQDYLRFIRRVGGSGLGNRDVEAHRLIMDGKLLTCVYESLGFPSGP